MIPLVLGALVSAWIALPVAALALLLIAWHSTGLDREAMPPSRRRIRQANSWVMMLGVPLFAIGVSVIDAQRSPRAFVIVWLVVSMLVLVCVTLAMIDAMNTWRLASHERRHLAAVHRGLASLRAQRSSASGESEPNSRQSAHDD